MNTFRIRPKSDYMHNASYEELYVLTEHWQSDLAFYRNELTFLKDVLNKFSVIIRREEGIAELQNLLLSLEKLDKRSLDLDQKIKKHILHIEELLENPFSHDDQTFRNEQLMLEDEWVDFVKDFRDTKTDLFKVTEHTIENDKLRHLLM